MVLDQISHARDKGFVTIQTISSSKLVLELAFGNQLQVNLVQGLDVVRSKSDWHNDNTWDLLDQLFTQNSGLTTQPRFWTHLGLPHQSVWVGELQLLHDRVNGGSDLGRVSVTGVDNVHWQRVRREEQDDVFSNLLWVAVQGLSDVLSKTLAQARGLWPSVNSGPRDLSVLVVLSNDSPQLIEGGTGGTVTKLWVLGEGHSSSDTIVKHLLVRLLSQWVRIAESNVRQVWCGVWRNFVQFFTHLLALVLGPFSDRRTASDGLVVALDFWGSSGSNKFGDVLLETATNWDQIVVREQTVEEIVGFWNGGWTTHVHEHDTGLFGLASGGKTAKHGELRSFVSYLCLALQMMSPHAWKKIENVVTRRDAC